MAEYIDRDALIEEHCKGCSADARDICKTDPVCATLMWLKDAPAADVAPVVHSHWVHDYSNVFKCFECLAMECMSPRNLHRYCPNCGARMDGE